MVMLSRSCAISGDAITEKLASTSRRISFCEEHMGRAQNGLDGLDELRAQTLTPQGCSLKKKVAKNKANRANNLSRQMKPSGEPETNFHTAFCLLPPSALPFRNSKLIRTASCLLLTAYCCLLPHCLLPSALTFRNSKSAIRNQGPLRPFPFALRP